MKTKDFFGDKIKINELRKESKNGFLYKAMENGGIFILDDVDQANEEVIEILADLIEYN